MELPYDELDMLNALKEVQERLISKYPDGLEPPQMMKDLAAKTEAETKEIIAQYHGISVTDLINSSNYGTLRKEWEEHIMKKVVESMMKEYDISDKEAWAIICMIKKVI